MSDEAWCQAQLGLNSGGLGLRSLFLHSSSAFIASFCSSGVYDTDDIHLTNALDHVNSNGETSCQFCGFLTCQSEASVFKCKRQLLSSPL